MKRFLIVLFLIFTVSAVVHADDLPSHVIAIKNGENATISWKNPDRMSFIRLYSIEIGEKSLVSEDFDLSDAGINEYTVKSSDEAKYLLNFRSASGSPTITFIFIISSLHQISFVSCADTQHFHRPDEAFNNLKFIFRGGPPPLHPCGEKGRHDAWASLNNDPSNPKFESKNLYM